MLSLDSLTPAVLFTASYMRRRKSGVIEERALSSFGAGSTPEHGWGNRRNQSGDGELDSACEDDLAMAAGESSIAVGG